MKNPFKIIPKKVIVIGAIVIVVFALAAGAGTFVFIKFGKGNKTRSFQFGQRPGMESQLTITGDMIAGSGVTNMGVTEERFEVEDLTTALEIEEVYITSEAEISKGDKVLKLSEESIEEARKELKQALIDAELAYRSGAISYEQSKITLAYERDNTLLEGQHAKAVYDETVASLSSSVEKAQEELDQANEDIAEYQSYVNDGSYKSYFKVDEYQAMYDKTLEALKQRMEEWGVSWGQVTGQGGANTNPGGGQNETPGGDTGDEPGDNSGDNPGDNPGDFPDNFSGETSLAAVEKGLDTLIAKDEGGGPSADQIQVLASLYKVLEKQRKDLDQAISDYEAAVLSASFELQTLQLKLPELQNALSEAKKNYQNQLLQANLTYETALTNAENAEINYNTSLEQAETTYKKLKKEWDDAKDNLDLFESSVGDGYFYASGSGTVLRSMARAGQTLSADSTVFMYSNPEKMTVSVSVDQANISKIAVDDKVYVQASNSVGMEGVVTAINPVSGSDSRTNVTYSITIQFSEVSEKIGANESVTVIFGMDEESIQRMIEQSQSTGSRGGNAEGFTGGSSDGQKPEGAPEGMDFGDMPEGMPSGGRPQKSDEGNN